MTRGGQAVGLLCRSGVDHPKWRLAVSIRFLVEGMRCYAVLEADLSRWKIIRRFVCTAVAVS